MTYHTNIRHQELVALLGSRNLYLRLVYAHIANYTQVKGAWCGSQRDLAAQLELPIATVSNQITELVTKGLIVREANMYRSRDEQVCSAGEQKCSAGEQNQPPIINNKIMKENNSHAHTHDAPPSPSFEDFLSAFGKAYTPWTELAAREKWNITSDIKKRKLLEAMRSGKWERPRPDWCIMDFPEPRPEIITMDDYYKLFGTTEEQDGWRREYRPDEKRTVYIKQP